MKNVAILNFTFSTIFFVFLAYAILHYTNVPIGNIGDWMFGVGAFAWLMIVITIPWNIYFEASNVLHESQISKIQNIKINENQLEYAKKMQKIGLWLAIGLHLASAGFFYYLSLLNVSFLSYWGAIFALVLTIFRPLQNVYMHISERLQTMRQEVTHPRNDIVAVQMFIEQIKESLQNIQYELDPNNAESFRRKIETTQEKHLKTLQKLQNELTDFKELQNQKFIRLQNEQETALIKIEQNNKNQIQNLAGEGKFVHDFLNNLTEIIRFIKKA